MMRMTTTTRGAGRRRAMATKAAMGAGGGAMCVVAACATWYAGWYAMVRARETSEVRVTARETRTNARVLAKCAEILDKDREFVQQGRQIVCRCRDIGGQSVPVQMQKRIHGKTIELFLIDAARQLRAIGRQAEILDQGKTDRRVGTDHARRA